MNNDKYDYLLINVQSSHIQLFPENSNYRDNSYMIYSKST
jgi:hypothetical protein